MDNLRFILVVALSLVLLMLWQEWEKDYGVSREALAELNKVQEGETERRDTAVPVVPVTPEIQQPPLSTSDNNVPAVMAGEEPIRVKTDLYQISIGITGGGIDKVELLDYPVTLETPDRDLIEIDKL